MPRLYVAGPMRGVKSFNFPAFFSAEYQLLNAGHDVLNPAAADQAKGFDATPYDGTEDLASIGFSLRDALGMDLAWITEHADGIATLPGWLGSKGARAEVATAEALGLPVASVDYWISDGAAHFGAEDLTGHIATLADTASKLAEASATPSWEEMDGAYTPAMHAQVAAVNAAGLDLETTPYRPAIGDRVRIVDADYMDMAIRESDTAIALIGLVTELGCDVTYDATGIKRLHPIEVSLDDDDQQWHAVTVELIETAAEIAEYEAALASWDSVPRDIEAEADRILEVLDLETAKVNSNPWTEHFAVDEDPRPDDGTEWAGCWPDEDADAEHEEEAAYWRDFEREIESDLAIEQLRERLTGEVIVTSSTGGQKGQKPAQMSTVDAVALLKLAEVSGYGSGKYEAHNYLRGYAWSLSLDALFRHILAFQSGEDHDPESGLPHITHAAWHCLALTSFLERGIGTDDRFVQEGVIV